MNGDNPYNLIMGNQINPLAALRSAYSTELSDPGILQRLYSLTHREVGGQGPAAQQAFMESVINRASARGMTLSQAISDKNYFPSISLKPTSLSQEQATSYGGLLRNVLAGSNVSNFATGNASGTVGFAGGPQTFQAGGERFGIEGPDKSWAMSVAPGYQGTPAYLTQPQPLGAQNVPAPIFASAMAERYPAQPGAQMGTWANYQTALTQPTTTERVAGALGTVGSQLGAGMQQAGQQQAAALGQGTQAAMSLLQRQPTPAPQIDWLALQRALEQYFT
jgi:hypothetical protein